MDNHISQPVDIETIVDELSILSDGSCAYISRKTGEVFSFTEEELSLAETDEDDCLTPEWQTEIIDHARQVMTSDDILTLPTQFEIDEYAIMEDYCVTVVDGEHENVGGTIIFCDENDVYILGFIDQWCQHLMPVFKNTPHIFMLSPIRRVPQSVGQLRMCPKPVLSGQATLFADVAVAGATRLGIGYSPACVRNCPTNKALGHLFDPRQAAHHPYPNLPDSDRSRGISAGLSQIQTEYPYPARHHSHQFHPDVLKNHRGHHNPLAGILLNPRYK